MFDRFSDIINKNEKYDDNIKQIALLEETNSEIISEMFFDINDSKEEILSELNKNKDFLKTHSKFSHSIDKVIEQLSENFVDDIGMAKLIVEILRSIESHENNLRNYEKKTNCNKSDAKGWFRTFTKLVKENLDNDN